METNVFASYLFSTFTFCFELDGNRSWSSEPDLKESCLVPHYDQMGILLEVPWLLFADSLQRTSNIVCWQSANNFQLTFNRLLGSPVELVTQATGLCFGHWTSLFIWPPLPLWFHVGKRIDTCYIPRLIPFISECTEFWGYLHNHGYLNLWWKKRTHEKSQLQTWWGT